MSETHAEPVRTSPTESLVHPVTLSRGTMVTQNLKKARPFYEEFLGFEAVQYASDAMYLRFPGCARERQTPGETYWVIDVHEVQEVNDPQRVLNHWGLDLPTKEAVDEAYDATMLNSEKYSIKRVTKVRIQHGAYGFYFEDMDSNWWEFLARLKRDPRDVVGEHLKNA